MFLEESRRDQLKNIELLGQETYRSCRKYFSLDFVNEEGMTDRDTGNGFPIGYEW